VTPLEELYQNVFKIRDIGGEEDQKSKQSVLQEDPFANAQKFLGMAKYQIENMAKVMEMTLNKKELLLVQTSNNARLISKAPKCAALMQMKKNVRF
jgi:hypothetical protein